MLGITVFSLVGTTVFSLVGTTFFSLVGTTFFSLVGTTFFFGSGHHRFFSGPHLVFFVILHERLWAPPCLVGASRGYLGASWGTLGASWGPLGSPGDSTKHKYHNTRVLGAHHVNCTHVHGAPMSLSIARIIVVQSLRKNTKK